MKVKEVEPCHVSGFGNPFVRDDYYDKVEIPGREACLYLYDMNIQTYTFNCHKDYPNVSLQFVYDTLSEENKKIADNLKERAFLTIKYTGDGEKKICTISFPAKLDDDVDMISKRLLSVVRLFKYQDIKYGYRTLDEYLENEHLHGINYSREELIECLNDPESIEYYDSNEDLVWRREEYYQKHLEFLKNSKGVGAR